MTEITTDELDGARHVVAAALANTFADLGDREPLLEDVDRCAARIVAALSAAGYIHPEPVEDVEKIAEWLARRCRRAGARRFGEEGSDHWRVLLEQQGMVTFAAALARAHAASEAEVADIDDAEVRLTRVAARREHGSEH